MKKILMITLFLAFNLNANAYTNEPINEACAEYAANAANLEEDYYGEMCAYDWGNAALDYYDFCVESGGNLTEPIFL